MQGRSACCWALSSCSARLVGRCGKRVAAELHGDGADAGLDVHRREVGLRRARPDRSVAARADELEPGQRHDQVRRRRDRVVRRRRRGLRGDEPVGHGQDAEGEQGRGAGLRPARRTASRTRSRPRSRKRCRTRTSSQTFTTVYGGVVREGAGEQRSPTFSRSTASRPSSRTRSSSRRTTTPTSSARRPSGRRSAAPAKAGSNVIVGVIDTGVWPEHPMLVADGHRARPRPGNPPWGCQFGDGSDVAHLGPAVRLQQEADRRLRVHRPRTWPTSSGSGRPGVLQQHDRRSARRATPRVTARTR